MTLEPTRRQVVQGTAAMAAASVGSPHALGRSLAPSARTNLLSHRFGVNYVPSGNWYFCYNDWNAAAIDADLGRVAEIGADHIRFMIVWPWFQPNPSALSAAHLDRMDQLIERAGQHGLDVVPSLFTGWLSGFHFNPNFYDNEPFYTSPKWAAAQQLYLEGVCRRLAHHPNVLGVDLGNELACNWTAPTVQGDAWMARMFALLDGLLPGRIHVNGVDHKSWFSDETFSAGALMTQQPIASLHCWPFWTGAGKLGGPLDKPYTHLIAGMAALARSIGGKPAHPIWAQEFGACTVEMSDAQLLRFMDIAIERGVEEGVSWFTWWSSHDVSRRFAFHPFEYGLGLIDERNRVKPTGRKFREIADRHRGKAVVLPTKPLAAPPTLRTNIGTWRWLADWMEYPIDEAALASMAA